jgi:PAS domain S-box-containing protein
MQVAAREGKIIAGVELDVVHADGHTVRLLEYAAPLFDENGQPRGSVGAFIDVTERRRSELLLSEQKKLLELIAAGDGLEATLVTLCRSLHTLSPSVRGAVLLASEDRKAFERVVAPDLDPGFAAGVKAFPIDGTFQGICGDPSLTGQPVESVHLSEDARWNLAWRRHCTQHAVQACHSSPISDARGIGVGLLMLCFDSPRAATPWEVRLATFGVRIASIAVQHHQATNSLRAERERFRTLADNISQLAWIADRDGLLTWYNQRWFDYTGTTLEDVRGDKWRGVHHPDHVDRVYHKFKSCIVAGTPWEDTFPLRSRTGEYRWFLSRAVPIFDGSGVATSWFGTNTDVTELREAQGSLSGLAARLRLALKIGKTGVWDWHFADDKVTWSDETCAIFGVAPDAFGGTFQAFSEFVHKEDRAGVATTLRGAIDRRQEFSAEYRVHRADGAVRWVANLAALRYDAAGVPIGMIGTITDITERKLTLEELRSHRERLEELVQERTAQLEDSHRQLRRSERMAALGTLSAGLGHDMGNLLFPMLVRLDSLSETGLTDQAREDVRAIQTSAEYLRKLTSGLRLLALEPGKLTTQEPTILAHWWQETLPMLRAALPRSVELTSNIPGSSWTVPMSRVGLTQAIFNLVQNAGDAVGDTLRGKVAIDCTPHKGKLLITVRDNGPGMTPDTVARCMEPFFSTKIRGLSTGMGLSLVYGLVRDIGGSIAVESAVGHGSLFTLTLPAAPNADAAAALASAPTALVHIQDVRVKALVFAELRALGFDILLGDGATRPSIYVSDSSEVIPRDAIALLLAPAPPDASNVITLEPRPAPSLLRAALMKLRHASLNKVGNP